jgi:MFS family permease
MTRVSAVNGISTEAAARRTLGSAHANTGAPSAVDARQRHHRLGFWSAAFAFFVVMAFSTVPSPLYGLYQARDGFSSFLITIIYAAYAVGVISGLLFAGHLSDWYGRRRVLVPAIVVSIISAIVFLLWRDLPGLLIARVIDGLSVGVVTATATAYLGELYAVAKPDAGPRGSQLIATAGNLGGLGFGPVVAGVLAKWVKSPLTVPFIVFLGLLCAVLAAVTLAPETRPRRDPMPTYRTQRMSVPDEARGTFAAAAVSAFIAFGALGLFTALSATFLITLHHSSVALAGGTVGLMFAGGVIAQITVSTWALRRVLILGMALMLVGLTLTVVATWLSTPSLALFLAGGAVTGAGAGAVFKGAVGTVVAISTDETRAEALAGLFLAAYLGLSIPAVGAGVALTLVSPRVTLLGFALVVALGIVAAAPRLLRRDHKASGDSAIASAAHS